MFSTPSVVSGTSRMDNDTTTATTEAPPASTTALPPTTTTAPATTLPPTTTTTTLPPTTTTTTLPSTTTTTTAPPSPSELVTLTGASKCTEGVLLSDVVITAVHEFPGGWVWLSYGVYLGQKFGYSSNQGLPPLAPGESTTVAQQLVPGPVRVEVRLEAYGDNIVEAVFEAPACALPATAPTISATVARCSDEDRGAIAITVTNTPGGPESLGDLGVYEAAIWPPEGDMEFWSYYRELSLGDGEQETMMVDELTLKSPDASRAGRAKPLATGDYVIILGWSVSEIGYLRRDPVVITVPACGAAATPENANLAATGPRTAVLPIVAVATGLVACGLALMELHRRRASDR
jgi:hypothetical protein